MLTPPQWNFKVREHHPVEAPGRNQEPSRELLVVTNEAGRRWRLPEGTLIRSEQTQWKWIFNCNWWWELRI